MATIKKLKSGSWQVQIARKGVRESKSFPTKLEAKDWAALREHQAILKSKEDNMLSKHLLADVFNKYAQEVSPKKRGARWEIIRLERLKRDFIAQIHLTDLRPVHLAGWRDQRLNEVSGATVRREMQLISGLINSSRKNMTDARALSSPQYISLQPSYSG